MGYSLGSWDPGPHAYIFVHIAKQVLLEFSCLLRLLSRHLYGHSSGLFGGGILEMMIVVWNKREEGRRLNWARGGSLSPLGKRRRCFSRSFLLMVIMMMQIKAEGESLTFLSSWPEGLEPYPSLFDTNQRTNERRVIPSKFVQTRHMFHFHNLTSSSTNG